MVRQLGFFGDEPPATGDPIVRNALLSVCGTWRYWLSRVWDLDRPIGLACLVNPSTADHRKDDPTVQSLVRRARIWGWGGFYIVNKCAFRSPHPNDLLTASDPVGPENDSHIARLAAEVVETGGRILVAWGQSLDFADPGMRPDLRGRTGIVLAMLTAIADVYCIGRTSSGAPAHPMARGKFRIPDDTPLDLYMTSAGTTVRAPAVPFTVKPPHPDDRPRVGLAAAGVCAWCGKPAEGRYGLQASEGAPAAPLCNACGPSFHPTIQEVKQRTGALRQQERP